MTSIDGADEGVAQTTYAPQARLRGSLRLVVHNPPRT
jgi:hypothetical protein